jgi:hypothetical protein
MHKYDDHYKHADKHGICVNNKYNNVHADSDNNDNAGTVPIRNEYKRV